MKSKVVAVVRSFQGGATFDTFDVGKFQKGVYAPLSKLLETAPEELAGICVVTCGEPGSRFAEEVKDGFSPTTHALHTFFPSEISSGKIVPLICEDWGLNAGSGTALNLGLIEANAREATHVLNWSPEIDLTGHRLSAMIEHGERHALELVGYARNRWYQRIQWMFAQNTCALWDINLLNSVNGMNPVCNGDGVTKIQTIEYGEVSLAGMEDIEAYFRACVARGSFIRWGIVGRHDPAVWNLALKRPGTPEYEDNQKKIARQGMVMDAYAKRIFPDLEPIDVHDRMMESFFLA